MKGSGLLFISLCGLLDLSFGIEIDEVAFRNLVSRIDNLEKENLDLRRQLKDSLIEQEKKNVHLETTNHLLEEKVTKLENDIKRLQPKTTDTIFANTPQRRNRGSALASRQKSRDKRILLSGGGGLVAFTAAISPTRVLHHADGQSIVFDKILTNLGGAYDPGNGTFVIPVKGLYLISCSLLDDQAVDTMLHGEIVVNDIVQARVFAHSQLHKYRDQGAQTIFLQVNQGDVVRVRHVDEDNGVVGGALYSTFSGYLLWPME